METTTQERKMNTADKTAKIATYFVHHRSNGMSVDEAINHIATRLKVERDTVLVAIHYFLTH